MLDEDFQRRIIDVFINSVYVYDDKIVIYYNIKDGKQVSYIEMLESSDEPKDEDEETKGLDAVRISRANLHPETLENTTFSRVFYLPKIQ